MDKDTREKAGKTAVDGFFVIERIYRHAYQTLIALKDKLKDELNLRYESPLYNNSISTADPKSWIFQFRGLYLTKRKISLEEYNKKETPILFLQASLCNPNAQEPLLRYGIIERIFKISTWKGARFDDYFRKTLSQLHSERNKNEIKTSNCEAKVNLDEKLLLDLREEKDIVALAEEIVDKYGKKITRPNIKL